MKKIKVLCVAAAFAFSGVVLAETGTEPNQEQKLNKEIGQLLDNPTFDVEEELTAYVTFTLNDKDEIVVLTVDSESNLVESFIKNRLNYKKVATKLNTGTRFYKVPVRLVATA